MTLADLCDVVYALQVDYYQRLEIAGGGEWVEKYDAWLESTPNPEKDQLLAALGVAP